MKIGKHASVDTKEVDKDFPPREQRLELTLRQDLWLTEATFHLTKGEAKRLGERLIRWSVKK